MKALNGILDDIIPSVECGDYAKKHSDVGVFLNSMSILTALNKIPEGASENYMQVKHQVTVILT